MPALERADQGGRRVVARHPVALDHLEVPARVRGVRHTLVDHLRDPVRERTVDLVGVRGDPGQVRGAPVDVVVAPCRVRVGEQEVVRPRGRGEVPAGGVHEPLGLSRGAGGVHDEQRVLRVEGARGVGVRLAVHDVVPPQVSALGPRDVPVARAVQDEDVLDRVVPGHGLVRVGLHGDGGTAAELAVGGDEQLGARVLDAEPQRLRREPAEHERVHGADPRARQRDDDRLDEHGQVHDDAVARLDAQLLEGVRGLGDLALQLCVGDGAAVAGLALEVQGDLLPAPRRHVAVHAVHGHVQGAVLVPADLRAALGGRVRGGEGACPGEGSLPAQTSAGRLPEREPVRLGHRAAVAAPAVQPVRRAAGVDVRVGGVDERLREGAGQRGEGRGGHAVVRSADGPGGALLGRVGAGGVLGGRHGRRFLLVGGSDQGRDADDGAPPAVVTGGHARPAGPPRAPGAGQGDGGRCGSRPTAGSPRPPARPRVSE
ncbi:hypothetical protein ACUW6W_001297 [Micrococcus sp. 093350064-1]